MKGFGFTGWMMRLFWGEEVVSRMCGFGWEGSSFVDKNIKPSANKSLQS